MDKIEKEKYWDSGLKKQVRMGSFDSSIKDSNKLISAFDLYDMGCYQDANGILHTKMPNSAEISPKTRRIVGGVV